MEEYISPLFALELFVLERAPLLETKIIVKMNRYFLNHTVGNRAFPKIGDWRSFCARQRMVDERSREDGRIRAILLSQNRLSRMEGRAL